MAKQITFTFDGKDYCLEFTRKTVERMEANGFDATEFARKPATYLPQLFAGAFMAHHRFIKKPQVDEIFEAMPNKDILIEKLAEMYTDPIESMFDEPEKGNVDWTASW